MTGGSISRPVTPLLEAGPRLGVDHGCDDLLERRVDGAEDVRHLGRRRRRGGASGRHRRDVACLVEHVPVALAGHRMFLLVVPLVGWEILATQASRRGWTS